MGERERMGGGGGGGGGCSAWRDKLSLASNPVQS